MMFAKACAVCSEPAKLDSNRCIVCDDYLAISHAVELREAELTRRVAALGWSATWHGPYDQRWAQLSRREALLPVTLAGRVIGGLQLYGKASVADINRWFRELREAFYER